MARRGRQRAAWGSNEDAGKGRRRLRYWADLHDGRGYMRHSKTIRGTYRDGELELSRLMLAHSGDAPAPTVLDAFETWWLPDAEDRVASGEMTPTTLTNYMSRWNAHVAPAFGDVRVTDVTPLDVQQWLLGMTKSMAGQSLAILAQVLDFCVRYGVIAGNPARMRYRMPKTVVVEHAKDIYTLDEACRAIEAARGTVAYMPAVLSAIGSCRVGEALAPTASDVTAREASGMTVAVVDVHRQVDRGGRVLDRLKTAQSARPVVIPEPWSLDVLAVGSGWLCDGGDGSPCSQRVAGKAWLDALSEAGVEPIPMRNLRNSWRTFMRWELGVPEDMLEKMMGHVGRNVGEVHYDRPDADVFADVVAEAWVRHRMGAKPGDRDK